jgi:diacylglycerol kinase (ATP)
MMTTKQALIIINPGAGGGGQHEQMEATLLAAFASNGWDVRFHHLQKNTRPESLIPALKQLSEQDGRLIVAAGGDGTVSLVAAAMMKAHVTQVPLGVFPGGTANMLCKEMGNPISWPEAATFLATTDSTLPLDVMGMGDDYFILRIGIGLDAETIRSTTKEEKRKWGGLAYLKSLLSRIATVPRHGFTCRIDGRRVKFGAVQVFVANGGGLNLAPFRIGPGIRFDDGVLNVCAYDAFGWWDYCKVGWKLFRRQYHREPLLRFWPVRREVTVGTRRPLPVQADGEPCGQTPVMIKLIPHALKVVAVPTREAGNA